MLSDSQFCASSSRSTNWEGGAVWTCLLLPLLALLLLLLLLFSGHFGHAIPGQRTQLIPTIAENGVNIQHCLCVRRPVARLRGGLERSRSLALLARDLELLQDPGQRAGGRSRQKDLDIIHYSVSPCPKVGRCTYFLTCPRCLINQQYGRAMVGGAYRGEKMIEP